MCVWWMIMIAPLLPEQWAKLRSRAPWSSKDIGSCRKIMPILSVMGGIIPAILGRFDSDGFLFYAGRKAEKELIKPGGENVYPAEVEKVVLQHPAVAQTVVIGVPDAKWKEGIKAVCQLHADKSLTSAELIRFVGERIASFKKPQYVEFVSEFPLKTDGSLDREAVKSLYGKA